MLFLIALISIAMLVPGVFEFVTDPEVHRQFGMIVVDGFVFLRNLCGRMWRWVRNYNQTAEVSPLLLDQHARPDQLHKSLQCPITKEYFRDPVLASDGNTYERFAIVKFLQDRHDAGLNATSPVTGAPMTKVLRDNIAIRNMMGGLRVASPEEIPQTFEEKNQKIKELEEENTKLAKENAKLKRSPAKRGPGRPRRNPVPEIEEAPEIEAVPEIAPAPIRRRGRPPRRLATILDPMFSVSDDEDADFVPEFELAPVPPSNMRLRDDMDISD